MPTKVRHLKPADYRTVPWKNGGGGTTEIAVDPPESSVNEPFRWRLSLARVERSGPFSAFPGYDRSIMLVSGHGMVLDFAGHGQARLALPFAPVAFAGEWATEARLIGGASEDFNVMSDRRRLRHLLRIVQPHEQVELAPTEVTAIVCFEGAVEVRGLGVQSLKPRETLVIEAPGALIVGGEGVAAVVQFSLLAMA